MSMRNEEMVVRYVERFRSAVGGGGFEGFFRSAAGNEAQATLNALLVVGAIDAAALLRRAMGVFEGGAPPRDRLARREAFGRIDETGRFVLRRLDETFRRCDGELARSLTRYALALEEQYCAT